MRTALLFVALAGCSAGTPGTTVSCDYGTQDFCTQTVSSSKHSPASLEADCTSAGGTVTPGCVASAFSGTCDDTAYDDTTTSLYYYAPTFDTTSAQADCTSKSGAFTAH